MQAIVIACWALCAALFAAYAVSVAREIAYVTLPDGRKAERRLPLSFRLLLPLAPNFAPLASRPAFEKTRLAAERLLVESGLDGVLSGAEFIALKFLEPIAFGAAAAALVAFASALMPGSFVAENRALLVALAVLFGYAHPLAWLRGAKKRRHLAIERALPFALDLLTLSVEAGMDFMSALQRNCARGKVDPLNEELMRMTSEIQVGTPRRVALKSMAARVGQPDLAGVANALVQADELGVSIGTILRIQSEQLRSRRFERAEKLANEAPVKMLGPLMLCIFPAVFVILLAPILMHAAKSIF